MHGVVRQIKEERLLLIRLDELHRLGGLAVGEELAFRTFGQGGDLVRGVVTGRLSAGVAADVEVEAVLLGIVSLVALLECRSEVPLADARGRVAGGFELFGQGDLLEGQELLPIGDLQFGLGAAVAGDPVREVQAGGIFAGQQGGPGGGADRAGLVTVREADAILGQLVDVRRLVELASIAGEIGLSHVVDQDYDDVGRGGGRGEG